MGDEIFERSIVPLPLHTVLIVTPIAIENTGRCLLLQYNLPMLRSKFLIPFVFFLASLLLLFAPLPAPLANMSTLGSQVYLARVEEVLEEGLVTLGEVTQSYQLLRVRILEGPYQQVLMEIDYGRRQVRSDNILLRPGDRILVSISKTPDNVIHAYFVEHVRTKALFWLGLAFVCAILWLSGWKGLRSLFSMGFSLLVIARYIIPSILNGGDPLWVSISGSALLLGVTLYLTYGWDRKTHASVLGMLGVLLLAGLLSDLFLTLARLNGQGDENALFLLQSLPGRINLRGLLLGGMLIGALGVLDDLVTTQAAAVFEIGEANPALSWRELYRRAMRVGQDHVAATVNTLVLAYAGASLPMLLLFSLGGGNYLRLINYSFIAEEIVRTLVGSLALTVAVPLTTLLAIWLRPKNQP